MSDYQDFFAHFPDKVSQEMVDYATDTVFLDSRYVFVRRKGDYQYGYCTHCKQDYMTGVKPVFLKHNQIWKCRECNSKVVVKSHGKGRKKLFADAYFVWFEKSRVNPEAITARGIYAYRNYVGDYREVKTQFSTVAMYLFEPGRSQMLRQSYGGWYEPKSIISESEASMKHKPFYEAHESVAAAVKGTPFQYSTWEKYRNQSYELVQFFDLAARYPCVEYLSKMGFYRLIDAKLSGCHTYRVINWRGKTPEKVLRLSKAEIREFRNAATKKEPITLHSYHFYKKRGLRLSFEEADLLSNIIDGFYYEMLGEMIDQGDQNFDILKISKYILKQLRRREAVRQYHGAGNVLSTLRDYWQMCEELGMDLQKEHVRFPNNLHTAHQKAVKKIKIKENEALDELIAKRLKKLNEFSFEFNGLFVRPAQNVAELFREGEKLNHCVGTYAQRYAEGNTNLFFIRKVEAPDTPFYTMEIVEEGCIMKITQVYGKNNTLPTEEVNAFLKAFTNRKLLTKKHTRVEMAV